MKIYLSFTRQSANCSNAICNAVTIKLHQKGLNQQGNYTSKKLEKPVKSGFYKLG